MNCPTCGAHLHSTRFHSISVDRCPRCGGIWLGEAQLAEIVSRDARAPGVTLNRRTFPHIGTSEYRPDWSEAMDDEDCDGTPSSYAYRLQELWGGPSRPED